MNYTFKPAKREGVNVLVSFAGGTGSGKTFSSMEFAAGLAGDKPFAVGDTEARRALHYADRYRFDYAEIKAPFRPETYTDFIVAAEAAGFGVVLIDSVSHLWAGEGGLLDWHDEVLAEMVERKKAFAEKQGWQFDEWKTREASTIAAWIEPKTSNKRFVQRLLQARCHVVISLRAEEKIEIVKVDKQGRVSDKGKTEVRPKATPHGRDGWVPVCEKNLPYEMTCSFLLKAERPGVPIPIKLQEQHRLMFPLDKPVGRRAGEMMAAWANGAPSRAQAGPPSDKLAEALSVIERAKTMSELDAVGKGLSKAGLEAADLEQARAAFRRRGDKLKAAQAQTEAGARG